MALSSISVLTALIMMHELSECSPLLLVQKMIDGELLRTVGVLIFPFVRFGVRLGVIRAGVYILARTRMDRGSICVIG